MPGEIDSKSKLWTAVFTTYKLIGWYSFGTETLPNHYKMQNIIAAFTPQPIFLLINQSALTDSDSLPLNVFSISSSTSSSSASSSGAFTDIPFKIETSEVEKIALDHITKSTPVPGLSALEVQNQSLLTSLRILDQKVGCVIDTLQAMNNGELPIDHNLLRSAAKICQSLPPIASNDFDQELSEQATNSMVISYLSAATKTVSQLGDFAEVITSVYASSSKNF